MRLTLAVMLATVLAGPAIAEERRPEPPQVPPLYQQLIDCRTVADATERLACYDRQVAALDSATQSREIVIADQEQVRRTRRGLFGFAAPLGRLLGIGGDDDPEAEAVTRLETTVTDVRRARDGTLRLVFAEGGTWEQTDNSGFPLTPRVGQAAVLTRGALGSYFISINRMAGIRFRRIE